jgi:hypothetical protein
MEDAKELVGMEDAKAKPMPTPLAQYLHMQFLCQRIWHKTCE